MSESTFYIEDRSDGSQELRAEFSGRIALEGRIAEARSRGDEELLTQLQREHRNLRMAAQRARVRIVRDLHPARRSPRTSTPETAEPARLIGGYLASWATSPTQSSTGPHLSRYLPTAFDRQLRELDPATIPLLFGHVERLEVGRFRSIVADDLGLRALAEVDRAFADLCLTAVDVGDVKGFSLRAANLPSKVRLETEDGQSVFVIEEASLVEGSLAARPGDQRAVIVSVAGHLPAWRQVERSLARDAAMARLMR